MHSLADVRGRLSPHAECSIVPMLRRDLRAALGHSICLANRLIQICSLDKRDMLAGRRSGKRSLLTLRRTAGWQAFFPLTILRWDSHPGRRGPSLQRRPLGALPGLQISRFRLPASGAETKLCDRLRRAFVPPDQPRLADLQHEPCQDD